MSDDSLVVEFDVRASVEHAFAVWTQRAGTWWPKGHTVSGDPDSVRFEPRVGGRIVERARDGAEHVWGEVTAWDAPSRVEFLWHLFFDRAQATRVALTHRQAESLNELGRHLASTSPRPGPGSTGRRSARAACSPSRWRPLPTS